MSIERLKQYLEPTPGIHNWADDTVVKNGFEITYEGCEVLGTSGDKLEYASPAEDRSDYIHQVHFEHINWENIRVFEEKKVW